LKWLYSTIPLKGRAEGLNPPETILHGRKLFLARSAWILLVIFTLGVCVASLPVYFALFHTLCSVATQCASNQLSEQTIRGVEARGLSLNSYAAIAVSIKAVTVLVWVAVALVIFWRKSNHWLALLVALMLVTVSTGNADTDLPVLAHLVSPSLAFFISACSNFLSTLSFFLVLSLFPDGRFVPHWTRWVLPLAFAYGIVGFFPSLASTFIVTLLGDVLWIGCSILLVIAQIYRYFIVSTRMQRQQTKWVIFGLAMLLLLLLVEGVQSLIFPSLFQPDALSQLVGPLALLILPLSFGIAILRSGLWDVDVLINRTLVYGILTVSIALVYAALIIGLQAFLGSIIKQHNEVAIVISTLAIYALFQPLRRRIQNFIDRRFFRRKYDAAKTLAAFSATLRNEVNLETLSEHLVEVVQDTMQPASVSLWLRPPTHQQVPWSATYAVYSEDEARGET
jgi:hypothetical protein